MPSDDTAAEPVPKAETGVRRYRKSDVEVDEGRR